MKKRVFLLLLLISAFLVGCSGSNKVNTETGTESQKETQKETIKETEKETQKETRKETEKETEKETVKETEKETVKETEKETEKEAKDPSKKYVALTFDDGPHPTRTQKLLNILDKYNVKATFFMLGKNANAYPALVKEVASKGHEVANHSYNHPNLAKLSYDNVMKELTSTDQAIINSGVQKPKFVRPPYGSFNDNVKKAIKNNGQTMVNWSVDTLDWKYRNTASIMSYVKQQVHPGAIILMHDIHETSVDAVPSVIEYLKSQGYEFVTVSDIL